MTPAEAVEKIGRQLTLPHTRDRQPGRAKNKVPGGVVGLVVRHVAGVSAASAGLLHDAARDGRGHESMRSPGRNWTKRRGPSAGPAEKPLVEVAPPIVRVSNVNVQKSRPPSCWRRSGRW